MGLIDAIEADVNALYTLFHQNEGIFQRYFNENHDKNYQNLKLVDFIWELQYQRMIYSWCPWMRLLFVFCIRAFGGFTLVDKKAWSGGSMEYAWEWRMPGNEIENQNHILRYHWTISAASQERETLSAKSVEIGRIYCWNRW